jgi:hypothetical protein
MWESREKVCVSGGSEDVGGCGRGKGEIRSLHKYANKSRANELSKNIAVAGPQQHNKGGRRGIEETDRRTENACLSFLRLMAPPRYSAQTTPIVAQKVTTVTWGQQRQRKTGTVCLRSDRHFKAATAAWR